VVTATADKPPVADDKPPAGQRDPEWPRRLAELASAFHAWLMRPRVRLTVIGVTLLMVGVLITANSVWTLPLVIAGALMVAVAWVGHRLEGRFAVEWGEGGTRLAINATIKAPEPAPEAPALDEAARDQATEIGPAPRPEPATGSADVIEGEAHTVEINVGELKALIAAAESADAPADPIVRDIRVRRLADDGDRTPRPAA
jgi:hypothetical protein